MLNSFAFQRTLILVACVSGFVTGDALGAERLPPLGAALDQTSISGISSGAAMAVQFHVAHSGIVKGAGVIAGVPYDCAEQSASRATHNCMKPDANSPVPEPAHLKEITDALSQSGAVDDVANLRKSRAWLFSGKNDQIVLPPVMDAVRGYYALYVSGDGLAYRNDVGAGHAMVTDGYGAACDVNGAPYIDDCHFDAAGALLQHIYGPLNSSSEQPGGTYVEFDQKEFLPDASAYNHSMSDVGYAYVPKDCRAQGCRVHVALHGCSQQAASIGDGFYKHAGYNRWADANRIIVLYPQTISRWGWGWPFYTLNFVWNPYACWDWWGYDSAYYHTKKGTQVSAIRAMVDRLAARP